MISQRKVARDTGRLAAGAKARGIDHSTVCRIMSGKLWPEAADRQAAAA